MGEWNPMKALVTGATGFLGGHLVHHLVNTGWSVDAIVRDPQAPRAREVERMGARLRIADSTTSTSDQVLESQADGIFHLATHYLKTHTAQDLEPLSRANLEFGIAVLDAAAASGTPVVSTSSYFQFRGGAPHPSSLYAATKQAWSTIAEYYADARGLRLNEVVMYDTYGPGDTRGKLVPLLTSAVRSGETVRLGNPDQPLNLTHAFDVAAGLAQLMTTPENPRVTTMCARETVTTEELVHTFQELAPGRLTVEFNRSAPVNDLVTHAGNWPTPSGWAANVPLRTGIAGILAGSDDLA
ncbi:NAD(P)-dependent oxidoreductase [Demequina sp.]|uniref:NAD-dependent epimerase/dehydratase family protein n=1 Tax=Demequina sp. TaxID=2050685 RepID=UPI0025BF995E|nr:NAD(P)-dependent oxidoreductase [Demequina sp.]